MEIFCRYVSENHCGTEGSGYISFSYAGMEAHPTEHYKSVYRTMCFSADGNECKWYAGVQITNCVDFWVYQLEDVPACNLRYCTTNH